MNKSDVFVLLILSAGIAYGIGMKKLTVAAALAGALTGWIVYAGGGFSGISMMTCFFVLGTAATSWKADRKMHIGASAAHERTRTAGQVLANAGVAAIVGLLMVLLKSHRPLLLVIMAGSLATAAADTLASELGMVYGRRSFNILTGRRDAVGLDGVVSIEGFLIGAAAAAVIGVVFLAFRGWNGSCFVVLIVAGTIGNLIDSVLGAIWERKGLLSNNAVNFLSTLCGGLLAGLMHVLTAKAIG